MASAKYDPFKKLLLDADIDMLVDTIKVSVGRVSGYTFSAAHQYKSSVTTVQDASAALANKTTTGGVFDADDAVFTAVGAGAALDFLVIWKDTGVAGTSPVVCYLDGFSVTPNGGNINVAWDNGANKIFKL